MSRDEFGQVLDKVRRQLTAPGAKHPQTVREAMGTDSARQRSQTWPNTKLPTRAPKPA